MLNKFIIIIKNFDNVLCNFNLENSNKYHHVTETINLAINCFIYKISTNWTNFK